jgi:hypothetical protein
MKKITAPLLLVGILSYISFQAISQAGQDQAYLYDIVILDSLYSNTLEENREFWVVLPDTFDKIVKQNI